MACPICDQKPMNCDCTPEERRMHAENEDLEDEVTRLRVLIQDAAYLLQGSPVGSGCYEAWKMLTENKQPQDAIAAACELMPKWIPVSEQLPVIKDRVLVRVDGWTTIAYRINASSVYNAWVGPDGHGLLPPSHWMPLPEPPASPS